MTTEKVRLDAWKKNFVIVSVNQGEVDSRFLEITLTDNGMELDLSDKDIFFYVAKPDKNVVFKKCDLIDEKKGIVKVELTSQMMAVPGKAVCEVHIVTPEKETLKFAGLELKVRKMEDSDSAIESSSEFSLLSESIDSAKEATSNANAAADKATESAGRADEAANNAETAANKANKAANNAETAAEKANAAADKATESAGKADEAATSVETAAENANAAADKATESAGKADEATINAKTAADKANTAADKATESASRADEAANNAETAADKADEAATNAETAAENANAAADKATESAGKADEAATSVETAAENANAAADKAEKAIAEYEGLSEKFNLHLDSRSNPHEVTTEQIGAVPQTRLINSKDLSSDIELNCSDIGAATANHNHDADEITSGVLSIERGGTGAKTVTEAQSALKIFTDISQLNVDYPCSTGDIVNAMPAGSIGFFNVEASASTVTDVATGFSFLEIYKATPTRVRVLLNGSPSDGSSTGSTFNIGQYNAATHTIESWKRIQTSAFATPINCGGTGANEIYTAQSNLGLMKRYPNFDHLTLSDDCTITDILNAMASNTYIETAVSTVSKYHELFPGVQGFARLVKVNADRSYAEFRNMSGNSNNAGLWIGYHRPSPEFTGWKKVYTSFDIVPIANGGTGATTARDAQVNLQIYSSLDPLHLSSGCTTHDIITALPDYSIFSFAVNNNAIITDIPSDWGQLTIIKSGYRKTILYNTSLSSGQNGNNFWFGEHTGSAVTWYKIFTAHPSCVIPILNGGTGATTAADALTNLGAMSATAPTGTGSLSVNRKNNTEVGLNSVAIGDSNGATGEGNIAIGSNNMATGNFVSIAIGRSNTTSGIYGATSLGLGNTSSGYGTIALGGNNASSGNRSVALGGGNISTAQDSCAIGSNLKASSARQVVLGKFNIEDSNNRYPFIIGGGTSDESRANLQTIDNAGNVEFSGTLKSAGLSDGKYTASIPSMSQNCTLLTDNIELSELNTTNKTIIGAINEIYGMIQSNN